MPKFGLGTQYGDGIKDMAQAQVYAAQAAGKQIANQRERLGDFRNQYLRSVEDSRTSPEQSFTELNTNYLNDPKNEAMLQKIANMYYGTAAGQQSIAGRTNGQNIDRFDKFIPVGDGNYSMQYSMKPEDRGFIGNFTTGIENFLTGEKVPATKYQTAHKEDEVLINSGAGWANPMLTSLGLSPEAFNQRLIANTTPIEKLDDTTFNSPYNQQVDNYNHNFPSAVERALDSKGPGISLEAVDAAQQRGVGLVGHTEDTKQAEFAAKQAKSAASQQVAKEFSNIKQKELEIAGDSRIETLENTATQNTTLSNKIKEAHDQIRKATLEVQQKEGKLYNEYDKTQRGILTKIPVGTERRNNQLIKMIDRLTHNINDHNRTKKENGRSLFTNDKITEMKSRLKDLTKDYTTNWQSSLRATGAFQTDSGNMFSDFLDASMQDQGAFDTIMKMIPGGRESDQAQWGPGVAARILNENGEYKYFRNAEDKLQYQDKISKGDDIGLDFLEPDSMVTYTPKGDNQQPRRGTLKSVAENLGISSDELIPDGYLTNRQQQIQEFKGVRDRHDNWRETLQIPSGILDPFRRGELQKRGAGWSLSILDKALEDPHANLRNKRRKLAQVDVKQKEDIDTTKLEPSPWQDDPEKDELGNQIGRNRFGNDKLRKELSGLNALLHKLEQTAQ